MRLSPYQRMYLITIFAAAFALTALVPKWLAWPRLHCWFTAAFFFLPIVMVAEKNVGTRGKWSLGLLAYAVFWGFWTAKVGDAASFLLLLAFIAGGLWLAAPVLKRILRITGETEVPMLSPFSRIYLLLAFIAGALACLALKPDLMFLILAPGGHPAFGWARLAVGVTFIAAAWAAGAGVGRRPAWRFVLAAYILLASCLLLWTRDSWCYVPIVLFAIGMASTMRAFNPAAVVPGPAGAAGARAGGSSHWTNS